eukprot:jgi/Botrbrau1/23362/Bobra.0051s0015.1
MQYNSRGIGSHNSMKSWLGFNSGSSNGCETPKHAFDATTYMASLPPAPFDCSPAMDIERLGGTGPVGRSGPRLTLGGPGISWKQLWLVLKKLLLFGGALWGFFLFSTGCLVVMFLLLPHLLAPATAYSSKELYFDYSLPAAIAEVSLLSESTAPTKGVRPTPAFPACCSLDVWVILETPETNDGNIFQIRGELLSGNGSILASISKPVVTKYRSKPVQFVRNLFFVPFVLLGFADEVQELQVPLFRNFKEGGPSTFTRFRATLQARASGGNMPIVYSSTVHVGVRMGFFRRVLHWVQLPWILTLVLCMVSVMISGMGFVMGLGCLAAFLWLLPRTAQGERPMAMPPHFIHVPRQIRRSESFSFNSNDSDISSGNLDIPDDNDCPSTNETDTDPWSEGIGTAWDPAGCSRSHPGSDGSQSLGSDSRTGLSGIGPLPDDAFGQRNILERNKSFRPIDVQRLSSVSSRKGRSFLA